VRQLPASTASRYAFGIKVTMSQDGLMMAVAELPPCNNGLVTLNIHLFRRNLTLPQNDSSLTQPFSASNPMWLPVQVMQHPVGAFQWNPRTTPLSLRFIGVQFEQGPTALIAAVPLAGVLNTIAVWARVSMGSLSSAWTAPYALFPLPSPRP
jgi:hypothetical protein